MARNIPLLEKSLKKEILLSAAIFIFFAVWLSPLLIALSGSFRTPENSDPYMKLFSQISLESYKVAFKKMGYFRALMNSVIITGSSVCILVFIVTLAGYAIARLKSKLGSFLQVFFMAGMIVSAQMSIIPMFKIVNTLGFSNTKLAPIALYTACSISFSVFLSINFVKSSVPYALEESATIDGAGTLRTFLTIVVPLIKPAITAIIITQGVPIWNDFFFSMLFLSVATQKTLPLVMLNFIGDMENATQWNQLFSACYLSALPILLAYAFLQRYFIGGLTTGAVKG